MADNTPPLDVNYDVSQAKTVVPLIADGHLTRLRLKNLSLERSEKGPTMKFEWQITEPVPNSEGGQIRPGEFGSSVFDNVQMYAKPDAKDQAWFVPKIAKRIDAALGTGDPGNPKGKPARPSVSLNPANADAAVQQLNPLLVGKEVVAKMKVRSGEYIGNEIGALHFPGDISA